MPHKLYGMSRDPKTKSILLILDDICKKCKIVCNTIHFQRNFKNWTSGNDYIDKFIQDIQLSAHDNIKKALEWIPYDQFYNIEYIAKGGFGIVYKAEWIRNNRRKSVVALKSLNNSKNIKSEFVNEV
jgi:hypothetical protein